MSVGHDPEVTRKHGILKYLLHNTLYCCLKHADLHFSTPMFFVDCYSFLASYMPVQKSYSVCICVFTMCGTRELVNTVTL